MSRISAAVNEAIEQRAGGYCEAGGAPLGADVDRHHRKRRGMGGDRHEPEDTAQNLILVHRRCHALIHANPEKARAHGWIVPENTDPATVPVQVERGLCKVTRNGC